MSMGTVLIDEMIYPLSTIMAQSAKMHCIDPST